MINLIRQIQKISVATDEGCSPTLDLRKDVIQPAITCSKLTTETLEQ